MIKPNLVLVRWLFLSLCYLGLFLPMGKASEPGWTIAVSQDDDWKSLEGQGTLHVDTNGLVVSMPENASASWALTTEPVWVYRYPILHLRYRARGIVNQASQPFLMLQPGSTGPVTPGADNVENPFARSGIMPVFLPDGHGNDAQIHDLSLRIFPPLRTEQFDRIVLHLQSASQPASFELLDCSFREDGNIQRAVFSLQNMQALSTSNLPEGLSPFPLPEGNVSLEELTGNSADSILMQAVCAGIPFDIHESKRIFSTPMAFRGAIALNVHRSCRELFLLMACDLAGTDGAFHFEPRRRIVQPERLIVRLNYADGTEERVFPYNLQRSGFVVDASAAFAYAIPADPQKVLETVRIEEYMSYGRLFLLAATLNIGDCLLAAYPTIRYPLSLPESDDRVDLTSAALTVKEDRYIRIDNSFYRMEIDAQNGGRIISMFHKKANREILHRPDSLFSLQVGGTRVTPEQIKFDTYLAKDGVLELFYGIQADTGELKARVTIQPATHSECSFSLQLDNPGYRPQSIRLRFPSLSGIQIGEEITGDFYLFPRRQADWSNLPVSLSGVHSGEFPLQFMDVYSESSACGLALHTRDTQLLLKQFRLEKTETESRMGVDYGFERPLELKSQESFHTASTVLQFHGGDWRAPLRSYREWCAGWYRPDTRTRSILKNVFLCRRDYPIGGTGYLFDPASQQYTFARLIAESQEDFGGIDLVDISGWAYSEQYGRVGEYERYELGGKENLRSGIAESHERRVPVGLYLEGYLLDPRSQAGRQSGREWQIIGADGQPKTWQGNQEQFMCPLASGWQTFLSQTLSHVARDTGADAVYMDQYGFADSAKTCYASHHGHTPGIHPVLAEHSMLQIVRSRLQKNERPVALYLEQTPNDVSSQYADAAFDYSLSGDPIPGSPAKLNLFRFAFPSFKIVQLFHAGIDPRAASEEDAKLCFFYGEAMWLKGRARSWFSRECREFIRRANKIFHDHEDVFASEDVEPMIPTQQAGLYANRFRSGTKTVITLYNAAYHSLQGLLLSVPAKKASAALLWEGDRLEFHALEDTLQVWGVLHPHAVSCFSIQSSEDRE